MDHSYQEKCHFVSNLSTDHAFLVYDTTLDIKGWNVKKEES